MRLIRVAAISLIGGWLVACADAPSGQTPGEARGTGGTEGTEGTEGTGGSGAGTGGGSRQGSGGSPDSASGEEDGPDDTFTWPEHKRAAVTLSYDDGLDGQLQHAVPALDARGLHGTFFLASFPGVDHDWALPNLTSELSARHRAWQAVQESGHELGAHTIHHPCESNDAGFRPEDYDAARMADELDESTARLERLGARPPLTFAYPCHGDVVGISGGTSYVPLVNERYLAARTSVEGVSVPPIDSKTVAQRFGDAEGTSAEALVSYVDEAIALGGWAVFTFHGIGPQATDCDIDTFDLDACALNYLTTSNAAHEALLDYLVERESDVWTAPMKEVALHLQSVDESR